MHTLDTNAIIYFLKGDAAVAELFFSQIFLPRTTVYISSITELELLSGHSLTKDDLAKIAQFVNLVSIIPVDSQIAHVASAIRRGTKVKVPDAVIAATALFTGSTLVTRNTKDFRNIPNLSILEV